MRFIHTADWHLGNAMHNIDRTGEQEAFLEWLHDAIIEKGAEALIVSGDVFDTANPPVRSRQMYFHFLSTLANTPCRNVVVVGGNHDSGQLLDAPRDVLTAINTYTVGTFANRNIKDIVLPMLGEDGSLKAVCAAVPFVREADLRQFDTGASGKDKRESREEEGFASGKDGGTENALAKLYLQAAEAADDLRGGENVPLIATGHLFAAGLEGRYSTGAEGTSDDGTRAIDIVGDLGRVSPDTFPKAFDYVALGHIHYTTMVGKKARIRYSGSPFVLGFDDANIAHCVLSVDVEAGKSPVVEKINVPQTRTFKTVEGTVQELQQQIAELIKEEIASQATQGGSIAMAKGGKRELCVEVRHDRRDGADARTALEGILQNAPFKVVSWKAKRTQTAGGVYEMEEGALVASELSEEDVFKRFITKKAKAEGIEEDSKEMKDILNEYLPMFKAVSAQVLQDEAVQ